MIVNHFEFLVEEPSAEVFLNRCLPKLFGEAPTFSIHAYQGKADLLRKLQTRLKGYAKWLPETTRVVVLVDCDNEDCKTLKVKMEQITAAAGLVSRSVCGAHPWRVVNRIAVEELEAWYFGAWESVRQAYPRLEANAVKKAPLRHSDKINGGTWEAFERIAQNSGYFAGGLRKVEAADAIGQFFNPHECNSPSFIAFREALLGVVAG